MCPPVSALSQSTASAIPPDNVSMRLRGWVPRKWRILSVISGIGSIILGWFSGRARRQAEEERARARREAFASARSAVHDAYDNLASEVAREAGSLVRRALADVLVEPVRTAVALRLVNREAARAAAAIRR